MDLTEHDAEFVLRNLLDGIKEIEGLKYDTDTAEYLNATKERVNQWKNRKTIPFADALQYAKNKGVSLSWLLLRQGASNLKATGVSEAPAAYNASQGLDMALFNRCLKIMGEEAERRALHLDAGALLKATAVLYHQLQNNDQEPDMQLVDGLLELAG